MKENEMRFLLSNSVYDSNRHFRGNGALLEVHSLCLTHEIFRDRKEAAHLQIFPSSASQERWPRCHQEPLLTSSRAGEWTDCSDQVRPVPERASSVLAGALQSPKSGYWPTE